MHSSAFACTLYVQYCVPVNHRDQNKMLDPLEMQL